MIRIAALLTGTAVALVMAAPAVGQTLTGCRERETGVVHNLYDTTLRGRHPFGLDFGPRPCETGDVEFALKSAGPQGLQDTSGADAADICKPGFRLPIVALNQDHAAAYRFFTYCAAHRLGAAAEPDAPRARFVGTVEITLPRPFHIVGVRQLDLRCTTDFPDSRVCTASDVLQGVDRPAELGLVRANAGDGADFLDAAIDMVGAEGRRGYRFFGCVGWFANTPGLTGFILFPSFGLVGWPDPGCVDRREDMACCAPAPDPPAHE